MPIIDILTKMSCFIRQFYYFSGAKTYSLPLYFSRYFAAASRLMLPCCCVTTFIFGIASCRAISALVCACHASGRRPSQRYDGDANAFKTYSPIIERVIEFSPP